MSSVSLGVDRTSIDKEDERVSIRIYRQPFGTFLGVGLTSISSKIE